MNEILALLTGFDPVSLKETDNVSLLDRIDHKFVFGSPLLPEILSNACEYYKVLQIGKDRIFSYRSLYFDTDKNQMYLDHHNGKLKRYKIRFRTYEDSNLSFLEIKFKTKNGRTIKNRIKKEGVETQLSDDSLEFLKKHLPDEISRLEPKMYTSFQRITLVNKGMTERVTIDFNLKFENHKKSRDLPNIAIAEIKKGLNGSKGSKFMEVLGALGIQSNSMSKYCIGRVLTDDDIKYNQFKKKLLIINKLDASNSRPGEQTP